MFPALIQSIQKNYSTNHLKFFEIAFLSLMLMSLPSIEAPKNIFIAGYILTAIWRQFQKKESQPWNLWDWIFFGYIGSALLSALFAGISPGDEWRGFRGIALWTSFGWIVARSDFTQKEITWIVWVTILGTLPPLAWGLIEYMIIHTKDSLQLHSVGHSNHSAIYLGIILGAMLSLSLSIWRGMGIFKKLGLILLPILFFTAIIIGQSRGVFGVSLVRISLIILLIPNAKKIKAFAFVIFAIVLALMPIMNAAIIEKQIANQNNHDVLSDRGRVWNVSIEAAHFHPIFGIGNGNWSHITLEDLKKSRKERGLPFDDSIYSISAGHSHSLYLTSLVERGIVGLIVLITFMSGWLFTIIRSYMSLKTTPQGSYVWGASLSAWIVTFGVGFVNSTFHHEHALLALLFLGLHLSYLKYHKINYKNKSYVQLHKK